MAKTYCCKNHNDLVNTVKRLKDAVLYLLGERIAQVGKSVSESETDDFPQKGKLNDLVKLMENLEKTKY